MENKPIEDSSIALKAVGLCFSYDKDSFALKNVSFEVKRGEYVALIGHNGSGKSTLAHLIMGLIEAEKGDLYIFNKKMDDNDALDLRKDIGIIFQNPDNQFIGATVREDIAFGLENDCVDPEKMEELVDSYAKKVGMYDYLDKEPSNLSGGQKQRVAIAGALVRHPKILIMDEATSMLDPKGKREILSLIKEAKNEDKDLTIISITHDIEEAYSSDHAIVLSKGEKVLDGTPEEVFSNTDKMLSLDLDIPFFKKLSIEMKKRGIDIKDASSIDELKKVLL